MSPTYATETPRDPTRPWAPSPFRRLARTHALSVAGDAIFTTTIAGLVFFNISDLDQARWQVALALIFTFVPFTVAAPFIGPLIDRARGGRKWMIVGLCALRAAVCFALIVSRGNALALYPLFLVMLVLSKGYVIARGTIVPTTVRSDAELVEANSKLSAISGFAAVAGGGPSLLIMKVAGDAGPDLALGLAGVVFAVGAVLAGQLPASRTAALPPDEKEEVELDSESIRHAARGVAFSRGVVGFLTFMLAFHFKDLEGNEALVGIGVSVVGAQLGFMVGAWLAPRLRRVVSEERMLMIALGVIAVTGVLTALMGAVAGAALLAFGVGLASNAAKQAFDALVQRDAPDANRGRAFARFETRFQLVWVAGALIPLAITIPIHIGFMLIALGALISLAVFAFGLRRAVADARRRPSPLAGEPELVEPRLPSRSFLLGRLAERQRRQNPDDQFDPDEPDRDGDGVHDATGFAIDPDLDADAEAHRFPDPPDTRAQGLDPGADATAVVPVEGVVASRRWGATTDPTMVQPALAAEVPASGAASGRGGASGAPGPPAASTPSAGPDAASSRRPGLFADISDLGLDTPEVVDGLFAPVPASPRPGAVTDPTLFDPEAWGDEDVRDDPAASAPPRSMPDPGPPSLVPRAGDSGEFYGAPSEAASYRGRSAPDRPGPPAEPDVADPGRPRPAATPPAEREVDAVAIADLYREPPWRDATTSTRPGFETTEEPASGSDERDPAR